MKKIEKFIFNIVVILFGAIAAGIVISLNAGSFGQILARYAIIGFVLLVLAYKFRVPGVPSFGHVVAISASLITIIIAAGVIDNNVWLVILGVCIALYSGWVLFLSMFPNIRRRVYPESEDSESP